jgi:uncharacterized membrane protein YgcG
MKWPITITVAGCLLATLTPAAWGRGGGGCLEQGTPVRTPAGTAAVETLRPGDAVVSCADGRFHAATVEAVFTVVPDVYYEIVAGGHVVRLTAEHPVATAPGVFRMTAAIAPGETVLAAEGDRVRTVVVKSVRPVVAARPAYNLLVAPGGTYLAGGIVVHNKGCFLPETLIRTSDGRQVPIAAVRRGDRLLAFTAAGEAVDAAVRAIVTHEVDRYCIVSTRHVAIHVTPEHPFYVGDGTFKTVAALAAGDRIFAFDGREFRAEAIKSIATIQQPAVVYNLQTSAPHTFLADGFLVHNKGGGGGGGHGGGGFHGGGHYSGGHYGGGSGSSDDGTVFLIFFGVAGLIIVAKVAWENRDQFQNLDFVYSRAQIEKKSVKTRKLLEFLARQDPAMAPDGLCKQAEATFLKLQQCWSARKYEPMRPLLMPDLYGEHVLEIAEMVRQHEINMIDHLHIDHIDLVNVRYTFKEDQREFTALVTATARDYYIDDRTRQRLRGDAAPAQFQEFWTFHYHNKQWLLREIEQSRESDALKTENFFEQFTDTGMEQIYGKDAAAQGSAGPWLERNVETKETRIERMLNFLVQTDRLWDRATMQETARRVFLELMAARQAGDPDKVPGDDVFPELAAHLKDDLARNQARGITLEFRNLCVRKVELILVRNYADNSQDEFVARVRAHAQRALHQNGRVAQQDEDVTPFEQFLTLGRRDNRWKLKEILSPAAGQDAVRSENLDEDSTPQQVQWYYEHKRAV